MKPGKPPGGQKAEGLPAGVAQGVAGGKQKGDEVPHVVGMEVGQGQNVDGREIEAEAQQGPQGAGAQVQDQEPAGGLERQGRRPPAQGGHPGAGPDDYEFHDGSVLRMRLSRFSFFVFRFSFWPSMPLGS